MASFIRSFIPQAFAHFLLGLAGPWDAGMNQSVGACRVPMGILSPPSSHSPVTSAPSALVPALLPPGVQDAANLCPWGRGCLFLLLLTPQGMTAPSSHLPQDPVSVSFSCCNKLPKTIETCSLTGLEAKVKVLAGLHSLWRLQKRPPEGKLSWHIAGTSSGQQAVPAFLIFQESLEI